MKYKVEGQSIIFESAIAMRNRKKGRRPSQRLAIIIRVSDRTLSDIARIYAANRVRTQYKAVSAPNCVQTRANLSHVLAGRKNSPAYIQAIESAWKLPIEEIRAIYREDKERSFSKDELEKFILDYSESHFPNYAKQFLSGKQSLFGGKAA